MELHEYQAKTKLLDFGIPSPRFFVIGSLEELEAALKKNPMQQAVVKVQIHAGGRGKAGGIRIAKATSENCPKPCRKKLTNTSAKVAYKKAPSAISLSPGSQPILKYLVIVMRSVLFQS